jgi:hypothetical protein
VAWGSLGCLCSSDARAAGEKTSHSEAFAVDSSDLTLFLPIFLSESLTLFPISRFIFLLIFAFGRIPFGSRIFVHVG